MTTGAPTSPMVTRGPLRLGEAFAANLQFAAGDGRGRRDLRDLRPGVWAISGEAYLIKIEPSRQQ